MSQALRQRIFDELDALVLIDPHTHINALSPASQTLADVLDELASGELRIGIHVIAFASGGSESFINVPEPGATTLLAVALAGLAAAARRRSTR